MRLMSLVDIRMSPLYPPRVQPGTCDNALGCRVVAMLRKSDRMPPRRLGLLYVFPLAPPLQQSPQGHSWLGVQLHLIHSSFDSQHAFQLAPQLSVGGVLV